MRRSYYPISGWSNFPEPEKFLQFVSEMLSEPEWETLGGAPDGLRSLAKCDESIVFIGVYHGVICSCVTSGIAAREVFGAIALRFDLIHD